MRNASVVAMRKTMRSAIHVRTYVRTNAQSSNLAEITHLPTRTRRRADNSTIPRRTEQEAAQ